MNEDGSFWNTIKGESCGTHQTKVGLSTCKDEMNLEKDEMPLPNKSEWRASYFHSYLIIYSTSIRNLNFLLLHSIICYQYNAITSNLRSDKVGELPYCIRLIKEVICGPCWCNNLHLLGRDCSFNACRFAWLFERFWICTAEHKPAVGLNWTWPKLTLERVARCFPPWSNHGHKKVIWPSCAQMEVWRCVIAHASSLKTLCIGVRL